MLAKLAVIVTAVVSDLLSDEMGHFGRFVLVFELYFSHDQALVFAKELVDFEGVVTTLDEPAYLVDDAWLAELHQLVGIGKRNLLFELIARQASIQRRAFNSDVRPFVADADAHGAPLLATDIALPDVALRKSLVLERVVKHEEFAFNLLRHDLHDEAGPYGIDNTQCYQDTDNPHNEVSTLLFLFLSVSCTLCINFFV